ncbi:MAG: hypothetical protein HUK14_06120 [Muribaculaceae bacterium]|nr:hypothetical protein [Muribaculaceae bacterium]
MYTGSHNTLTYLPPAKWWMRPFRWLYRCQNKTLDQQLLSGINLIDLRVRFDNFNHVIPCHGLYEAKKTYTIPDFIGFVLAQIAAYRTTNNIFIRLILEIDRGDLWQEIAFKALCKKFAQFAPCYITLTGGYRKGDWYKLVDLPEIPLVQCVSSMADDARFYERICPYLYARRMNAVNREAYSHTTSKHIFLFDFL